jgi:hypothetical protein
VRWSRNDTAIKPGQTITAHPSVGKNLGRKEIQREKEEEAWERIRETLSDSEQGCSELITEDLDQDSVTILLRFPDETREFIMRIPKGAEWAFVKSFANKKLGENKWVASFWNSRLQSDRWSNHQRAPNHGDIVRLHWIEEPESRKKAETEATNQYQSSVPESTVDRETQDDHEDYENEEVVIPTPIEQTGGLEAPLERIQLEAQRPLPSKGEERTKRETSKGRIRNSTNRDT